MRAEDCLLGGDEFGQPGRIRDGLGINAHTPIGIGCTPSILGLPIVSFTAPHAGEKPLIGMLFGEHRARLFVLLVSDGCEILARVRNRAHQAVGTLGATSLISSTTMRLRCAHVSSTLAKYGRSPASDRPCAETAFITLPRAGAQCLSSSGAIGRLPITPGFPSTCWWATSNTSRAWSTVRAAVSTCAPCSQSAQSM